MKKLIRRIIAIAMVCAVILSMTVTYSQAISDAEFRQDLVNKGFPLDYVDLLMQLHAKYPNWTFEPLKTNLNFDAAVTAESKQGYSTISSLYAYHLLMTKSNGSLIYTDGKFVEASDLCISYFMDPRNFLTHAPEMFQFLDLRYPYSTDETTLITSLETLIKNAESSSSVKLLDATDPDTKVSYARDIVSICQRSEINLNPYYVVSKIYQEVGTSGNGTAVSGKEPGYEGYYNYFNINATSGNDAVYKGLKYAKDSGWNTRYKAIEAGIKFLSGSYTTKGQFTSYLTKFNVNPSSSYSVYSHQYMTNVADPAASAKTMFNGYSNAGLLNTAINFVIPVYNNMPNFASVSLKLNASTNNVVGSHSDGSFSIRSNYGPVSATRDTVSNGTALTITKRLRNKETSADGYSLTWCQVQYPFWYEVSRSGNNKYTMYENVPITASISVKVGSKISLGYTLSSTASNAVRFEIIDPTVATVNATTGEVVGKKVGKTYAVAYTAAGSVDYINLNVTAGDGPSEITSGEVTIDQSNMIVSNVSKGMTAGQLLSKINQSGSAAVYNGTTQVSSGTILATGMKLSIVISGNPVKDYTIAVTGDVNCDGKVLGGDAVQILKYNASLIPLIGARYKAADVNGDGRVLPGDAVKILKAIG